MKLSSMRADLVRRFVVRGLYLNGHTKDLVLLVRWTGTPAYQEAVANQAFRALEGDASTHETYRQLANHVITGWDEAVEEDGKTPVAYTPASGYEILAHLKNEGRTDRVGELLFFVTSGDNFQRALVNAGDVGNG